jgi:hypothetical protein
MTYILDAMNERETAEEEVCVDYTVPWRCHG